MRKYSGEQELIWGGAKECEHQWDTPTLPRRSRTENDCPNPNTISAGSKGSYYNAEGGNTCSLCGAWKGAYGLEPTPEMYVQHTIEILREIRRVLRKDGVVFWNIGDSYATSSAGTNDMEPVTWEGKKKSMTRIGKVAGLKPKDLCLIPFRVAIAAQMDGWWVRSVIIWSKNNPMPESVTDRPTESHEYILMLTKSAKYYWDADAVKTPLKPSSISRVMYPTGMSGKVATQIDSKIGGGPPQGDFRHLLDSGGANLRSVWEFPTKSYHEAHFAVFPEKLPEICIKAATPEVGCCSKCGKPWERIVEKIPQNVRSHKLAKGKVKDAVDGNNPDMAVGGGFSRTGVQFEWEVNTLGWQPACKCKADKVPSIVLDPFSGAGTTLWVAKKLNRKAVGYEISEEYCQLAVERMRQQVML